MSFYEILIVTRLIHNSKPPSQTGSSSDPHQIGSGTRGQAGGTVQSQLDNLELGPALPSPGMSAHPLDHAAVTSVSRTGGSITGRKQPDYRSGVPGEEGRSRGPATPQLLLMAVAMLEHGPYSATCLTFKKSLKP